jgi:ribosomal-protein-alanine N-acetyltransferase
VTQILQTERLILRPARMDDVPAMHELFCDPRYMRYGAGLPHETLEETQAWVASMVNMPPGQGCDFIVEADGRAIGKCGIWRWPEIGYGLHPDYWGRGLAREAIRAVTKHVFEGWPDFPAITAEVDPGNESSIRLLNGLGFVETGRKDKNFQLGDVWVGTVYFALARPAS